ncbi:MAG: DUF167 domain-containing protein [Sedimentisphaerales bacterium]|nr:DUF167 domain-containing protein [Sedimentisphaerales bacterium]
MDNFIIRESDGGVVFSAKIVPGSNSPTRICGLLDGALKLKVSAAPEKGKANQCLLAFLAKRLGIKKNAINIISGQTSPIKQIRVTGLSKDMLLKKLNLN